MTDTMIKADVGLAAGIEERDLGAGNAQEEGANRTNGSFGALELGIYAGVDPFANRTMTFYTGPSFSYGASFGHRLKGSNAHTQSLHNLDGRLNLGIALGKNDQWRLQAGYNFHTSAQFRNDASVGIKEPFGNTSFEHEGNDTLHTITYPKNWHAQLTGPIAPRKDGSVLSFFVYVDSSSGGTYSATYSQNPTANDLLWNGASNLQIGGGIKITTANLAGSESGRKLAERPKKSEHETAKTNVVDADVVTAGNTTEAGTEEGAPHVEDQNEQNVNQEEAAARLAEEQREKAEEAAARKAEAEARNAQEQRRLVKKIDEKIKAIMPPVVYVDRAKQKKLEAHFKAYILAVETVKLAEKKLTAAKRAGDNQEAQNQQKIRDKLLAIAKDQAKTVANGLRDLAPDYFEQIATYMRDRLIEFYSDEDHLAGVLDEMLRTYYNDTYKERPTSGDDNVDGTEGARASVGSARNLGIVSKKGIPVPDGKHVVIDLKAALGENYSNIAGATLTKVTWWGIDKTAGSRFEDGKLYLDKAWPSDKLFGATSEYDVTFSNGSTLKVKVLFSGTYKKPVPKQQAQDDSPPF